MGASAMIFLQIAQGVMGVMGAAQQGQAAGQQADAEVRELERQKEEEALNARAKRSDRAREADKQMGAMIAAMADNGGAGTGNASQFAGEIGFMAGVDKARITGNSVSRINSLSSKQTAAKARGDNAATTAAGNMFSSILSAAGGISTTISKKNARASAIKKQKATATAPGVRRKPK